MFRLSLLLTLLVCLLANENSLSVSSTTRSLLQDQLAEESATESSEAGQQEPKESAENETEKPTEGEKEGQEMEEAESKDREQGFEGNNRDEIEGEVREEVEEEEEALDANWHILVGRFSIFAVVGLKIASAFIEYKDSLKAWWHTPDLRQLFYVYIFLFFAVFLEVLEQIIRSLEAGLIHEVGLTFENILSSLSYFATFGLCCTVTVMYSQATDRCAVVGSYNLLLLCVSLCFVIYLSIFAASDIHVAQGVFAGLMLLQTFLWVYLKGPDKLEWCVVLQVVVFAVVLIVAAGVNPTHEHEEALMNAATMNIKALSLEPLLVLVFKSGKEMAAARTRRFSQREARLSLNNVQVGGVQVGEQHHMLAASSGTLQGSGLSL